MTDIFITIIGTAIAIALFWLFSQPRFASARTSRKRKQLQVNAPLEETMRAVEYSLHRMGLQRVYADRQHGTVQAKKGQSWASYGEDIRVSVIGTPDGGCSVLIESESSVKTTRLDWGANARNVRAIEEALRQRLPAAL
jgi:hypothetical protein